MKQRIARALDWRNLGWRSPAWLHLVAVLGVCAVQAGCAGSVDSGSGAAAATGNGASPYDVGAIAPSSGTDPGTTASSSGTKLYVVAEGSRINVTVAGSSTPVIWAKLAAGDVLGFEYLGKPYKYTHGGTTTELLPESGSPSGMVASAVVAPNAEIGLPSLNLTGTAQPYVLIVRGPQAGGSYGYILSPCGNASCSSGPTDSTARTAAANQPVSVGNGHTLEFRAYDMNGVAKTVFALRTTTTAATSTSTTPTTTSGTTTNATTNVAPPEPTAPVAPTPPTAPTAKTTAKEDDSWSMTDWLLLGGAAVGAYAVYSNWGTIKGWFGSSSTPTTTRGNGSGASGTYSQTCYRDAYFGIRNAYTSEYVTADKCTFYIDAEDPRDLADTDYL